MVAVMWLEIKGGNSFGIFVLAYKCFVYMIDVLLLVHPICLCFAMIVCAVHVSR